MTTRKDYGYDTIDVEAPIGEAALARWHFDRRDAEHMILIDRAIINARWRLKHGRWPRNDEVMS